MRVKNGAVKLPRYMPHSEKGSDQVKEDHYGQEDCSNRDGERNINDIAAPAAHVKGISLPGG